MKMRGIPIIAGALAVLAAGFAAPVGAQETSVFNTPSVAEAISNSPLLQSYQEQAEEHELAREGIVRGDGVPIHPWVDFLAGEVTTKSEELSEERKEYSQERIDEINSQVQPRLEGEYGASFD